VSPTVASRTDEPALDASVVVATRERPELVARLLDALAAQEGDVAFEVVVVDDGSSPTAWVALQRLSAAFPKPIQLLRQAEPGGPARARNAGWRAARSPVVCFTDDDCRPEPAWLGALLEAMRGDADFVQGCTLPDPDDAPNRGPWSRTVTVPYEQGYYETCNIAYPRELLEQLDGFDESFRFPFGEDVDLAWRARERGYRPAFSLAARVRHRVWPSDYRAALRNVRRYEGLVHAFANHPQLRGHFGVRVFFRPTHSWALGTLAASAAVALRPRSAIRAVVWVVVVLRYAWVVRQFRPKPELRTQWLVVVPMALGVDVGEVAVLARSSIRYRFLLL
jgi:GT2 family glycosyltransferase